VVQKQKQGQGDIIFESPYSFKKQGETDYFVEKKISLMQNLENKKYFKSRNEQEERQQPRQSFGLNKPLQEVDTNPKVQESQIDGSRTRLAELKKKLEYANQAKENATAAGKVQIRSDNQRIGS